VDGQFKSENAKLFEAVGDDSVTRYVADKAELERELVQLCSSQAALAGEAQLQYTIIRPCYIYGPYNYAPRESFFIEKIVKGQTVPVPSNANSRFSMVYVSDLGRQLLACVGNKRAENQILNCAAPEIINYQRLLDELQICNGAAFRTESYSVSQVLEQNIALPFLLEGDDLVNGRLLSSVTDVAYTPFSEGISKTFAAFKRVYS
jgi:nucleoside-diphosphate-sugar epimerase